MSHHGIRAYDAMFTQNHTGKDTSTIANECMGSDTNGPFADELLFDKQTFLWVHTVTMIADVNVLAEQTSIFDHDVGNCRDAAIAADVDIVSEEDLRMKLNSRI